MRSFTRFVIDGYASLLNLYPPGFKDEFAGEMHTVFKNSIMDASEQGAFVLVEVCSREFLGLPFNILKEIWHEYQGKELNMPELSFPPYEPASWRDSIWAGLPHLLFALLVIVTGLLANTSLGTSLGIFIALLMLAGLLATIFYTWRKRWPTWSASWYGYAALVILLFGILPYQDWVDTAQRIFLGIRFVLLLLTLVVLLYWLSRRNPIEGLLMSMPVIILYWLPVMEFIPTSIRQWLTFWLFLLIALAAITITRLNDIKKAVWLVPGASLLTGFPIAYARTYWNNVPLAHATPPTLGIMIEEFSIPWLTSAALVLAPILAWGLWYFGKRYGRIGRVSAALMILGMIVNFFGHFSHWWVRGNQAYLNALHISSLYHPNEALSLSMVKGGIIILLVGAIPLIILSWRQNKFLSASFVLAPLALPLVAMFTVYFGNYIPAAGLSIQLAKLADIYRYLIQLLAALWLLLSGWTVTQLYRPQIAEGISQ
jgi:hypothetical protein